MTSCLSSCTRISVHEFRSNKGSSLQNGGLFSQEQKVLFFWSRSLFKKGGKNDSDKTTSSESVYIPLNWKIRDVNIII